MSNSTVKYSTGSDSWTFAYPTITVTQVNVPSKYNYAKIATRYVYTVRSILIAESAADLAQKKQAATDILMQVGGLFEWDNGGDVVISWTRENTSDFGPHPVSIAFDKYFDVRCAMMTWQVEVEIAEIDTEVMELIYTVSHTLDKNFYTQRQINGMMRLNAAKFTYSSFPGSDAYRQTIANTVCACPVGWQRTSMQFQQSEDGLALVFSITDEQRFAVLPADITDGDVSLSVSGNPRMGLKKDFTLEGWFEAPLDKPYAPNNAFVALASQLFSFKVADEAFTVKQLSLRKDIYRPRLAFTMAWDAFEPSQGVPGDTPAERSSNFMLELMTRADGWIQSYKGIAATYPGIYGKTEVAGWCGTQGVTAPVLSTGSIPVPAPGGGGTDPTGDSTDNSILPDNGEDYFYEYHCHFGYVDDYGIVALPKKDPTKSHAFQQVHGAQHFLTVVGRIVQHDKAPDLPPPPYENTDCVVLKRWVNLDEPLVGPVYTLDWKYLILMKKTDKPTMLVPYSPFLDASDFDVTLTGGDTPVGKTFTDSTFTNDLSDPT